MATLITLAQYRNYDDHMGGGWGVVMGVFMVVALVAVVGLVVWLVRSTNAAPAHGRHGDQLETARQVLDRRLAMGELTPDEYQERVALLGGPGG